MNNLAQNKPTEIDHSGNFYNSNVLERWINECLKESMKLDIPGCI